jgi:hypothetical protein
VTLVWCAPDGAAYPDEVQRAAQHALDLAVMRGAVLTHEVTDTTVRVVAVRVQAFKGALVALLGAPTC